MELISYKQAILAEMPKIEKPVGIEDVELIDSYKKSNKDYPCLNKNGDICK